MSKNTRDSIFFAFIFIFVGLTILVSLYATGYKFNLSWPLRLNSILVKTGMLNVDTTPAGALVYLNGRAQNAASLNILAPSAALTPAKIKNILPGDYTLRLERSGYWPFQEKITINPGQTTFAEDINLFRSDLPTFMATSTAHILLLSPSQKYLYLQSERKIINLATEETRVLPSAATSGVWLNNSDRLSANGVLYDPTDASHDLDYSKIIGSGITATYYDEASGRLYFQNASSLSRLSADGKTATLLLSGQWLAFEPRGENLYVVIKDKEQTLLRDYDLKSGQSVGQIILPSAAQYRFVDDHRPRLSLYDEKNQTLYLIDPANIANNPETINHIIAWTWSNDRQLFYYNNWEVYFFDLDKNSASLITRVGYQISGLLLNPTRDYLALATVHSLSVIDLKADLSTTVFAAEKINGLALDAKNNILYFVADIGHNAGVYELNLQ